MFTSILPRLRRLIRDESGPTAVEYAILLALIIATCLFSIRILGTNTNSTFNKTVTVLKQTQKTDGNQDGNGQW